MLELLFHWHPDLRQTSTKHVYVAPSCFFCNNRKGSNRSFRVNLKLGVFKCYKCGIGGKDRNKWVYYLKRGGKHTPQHGYIKTILSARRLLIRPLNRIEVYYGCETLEESLLPF